LNRKQKCIDQLKKESHQFNIQAFSLQKKIEQIKQKYKKQYSLFTEIKKQVEQKICKVNETENSSEMTDSLVENVSYLENQNMILQERIQELLSESERSKMIETFQGGNTMIVREVYAMLLSMNVGVNTVDKIVRAVLEKLGSIKVDLF
jgi:signal recognition particle GTPase